MNEAQKAQAMPYQSTIFGQLLKALPRAHFERLAVRYRQGRRKRSLSDWNHLVAMVFSQASGSRSLRDLERVVERQPGVARHLGLGGLKRSTLSDANALRPAGVFEDVARMLSGELAGRGLAGEIVRLIDATQCVASRKMTEWTGRGGLKLHMMYEPGSERPVCFAVTPQNVNDTVIASTMPVQGGATYVFDKGYYSFAFWARIDAAGSRFVTRLKSTSPVRVLTEHPVDSSSAVRRDVTARLNERLKGTRQHPLPKPLRIIDVTITGGRTITLASNDLESPAEEIAGLYKQRWQIELFFKWIKQNLKLGHFFGHSRNAAIIQIMSALIVYMLIRIASLNAKATLGLQASARLAQALLLARRPIADIFRPPPILASNPPNQLELWR
jgi:Transposase DDE domain.